VGHLHLPDRQRAGEVGYEEYSDRKDQSKDREIKSTCTKPWFLELCGSSTFTAMAFWLAILLGAAVLGQYSVSFFNLHSLCGIKMEITISRKLIRFPVCKFLTFHLLSVSLQWATGSLLRAPFVIAAANKDIVRC
jgi:hypothetical protein